MTAYDGPDPHGIVPEDFNHESIAAARRHAEGDYWDGERCRKCDSTAITPLSDKACSATSESWKCKSCGAKFDEPRRSRNAAAMARFERLSEAREQREQRPAVPDDTEQASLEEVAR